MGSESFNEVLRDTVTSLEAATGTLRRLIDRMDDPATEHHITLRPGNILTVHSDDGLMATRLDSTTLTVQARPLHQEPATSPTATEGCATSPTSTSGHHSGPAGVGGVSPTTAGMPTIGTQLHRLIGQYATGGTITGIGWHSGPTTSSPAPIRIDNTSAATIHAPFGTRYITTTSDGRITATTTIPATVASISGATIRRGDHIDITNTVSGRTFRIVTVGDDTNGDLLITDRTFVHTAPWARPTTTSRVLATLSPVAWLTATIVANRIHGTPATTAQRRRVRHLLHAAQRLGLAEQARDGDMRPEYRHRRTPAGIRAANSATSAADVLLAADTHATLTLLGGSADQATLIAAARHTRPDASGDEITAALRQLFHRDLATYTNAAGGDTTWTVAR